MSVKIENKYEVLCCLPCLDDGVASTADIAEDCGIDASRVAGLVEQIRCSGIIVRQMIDGANGVSYGISKASWGQAQRIGDIYWTTVH